MQARFGDPSTTLRVITIQIGFPKAKSPMALVWDRMVVCSTAKRCLSHLGAHRFTYSDLTVFSPHHPMCMHAIRPGGLSGVQVKPSGGSCSDLNDNSTSVRFADLNGDGRAEYLWLDAHGAVTVFLNG